MKLFVGKARIGRLDTASRRKLVAGADGGESLQQQEPPGAQEGGAGTNWSKSSQWQEPPRARERELPAAKTSQSRAETNGSKKVTPQGPTRTSINKAHRE